MHNLYDWLELLLPLLPFLRGWLRRSRRCHKRHNVCRHIPENIGRVLPPIVTRKF